MIRPARPQVMPCIVALSVVSLAAALAAGAAPLTAPAGPAPVAAPAPGSARPAGPQPATGPVAMRVQTDPATGLVPPDDPRLGWLGRWVIGAAGAGTAHAGSRLRFSFNGPQAALRIATTGSAEPARLEVSVDGGPRRPMPADRTPLPVATGLGTGRHTVTVDVASVPPDTSRWRSPLGGLTVTGVELGPTGRLGPRPVAAKLRLEFYGDAVTEGGGATGPRSAGPGSAGPGSAGPGSTVPGDATASFGALTAAGLHADGVLVGFPGQGVTVPGPDGEGTAGQSFDGVAAGIRVTGAAPNAVVVNYGSHDAGTPAAAFRTAYQAYLHRIRVRYPKAWIFAVPPFDRTHAADIAAAVAALHDHRIVLIDSTGWVPVAHLVDGRYPDAAGQRTAAGRLLAAIRSVTGWQPASSGR